MAKFYGVKKGREIGVFSSWGKCKDNVDGYSGAIFKSFKDYNDAYFFVFDKYPENMESKDEEQIENKDCKAEIVSYIDGSYDDSIKRFGYAGLIFHKGQRIEFAHSEDDPKLLNFRNVAGELKAAMYVMDYAKNHKAKSLDIYYDYTGIENWAIGAWKTNTVLTKDYAKYAKDTMKTIDIRFIKVKAHSGDKYNEEVDSLAKKALTDEKLYV